MRDHRIFGGDVERKSTDPGSESAATPLVSRTGALARVAGVIAVLAGLVSAALVVVPSHHPAAAETPVSAWAAIPLDTASLLVDAASSGIVPTRGSIEGVRISAPATVDSAALERDAIAHFAHGPLARVLSRRAGSRPVADSIASALIREATRIRVAPSLLAAVLITENPELDTNSVSSQGAMGLMQVMPFHAGEHGCSSHELLDIDTNICHGARIFGQYLKRTKDVRTALLRYNGCVRSTNTPRCERYPDKVMGLARRVRAQLLQFAHGSGTSRAPEGATAVARVGG